MGRMTEKIVFTTGGASGIGLAAAKALAAEGAIVYAADITEDLPPNIDDEAGGKVYFRRLDVRDETAISELLDSILQAHGRLDAAFNNAGILLESLDQEWDAKDFQRCMDINVTGVMLCLKHELRAMTPRASGSIVNTASIAGIVGLSGAVAYSASKHAVVGMTKSAALSSASVGIRVNSVCPGPTDTPMTEVSRKRRGSGKAIGGVPLGRSADPAEMAEAVLWLLSDSSSYVTGQALVVDGGYTTG